MRNSRAEILSNDTIAPGFPIGVFLAPGGCAEHEMGIDSIEGDFELPRLQDPRTIGIESRTMTRDFADMGNLWQAKRFQLTESDLMNRDTCRVTVGRAKNRPSFCAFNGRFPDDAKPKDLLWKIGRRSYDDQDLTAAWDGKSFALIGWSDRGRAAIAALDEGIRQKDVAIWIGGAGQNPFARPGLAIVRASLVAVEQRNQMREIDLERLRLSDAVAATGVIKRIHDANGHGERGDQPVRYGCPGEKGYDGIKASWVLDNMKERTEHPVVFYINPRSQQVNNHGWFTVEEIDEWLSDRGPMMKCPAPEEVTGPKFR